MRLLIPWWALSPVPVWSQKFNHSLGVSINRDARSAVKPDKRCPDIHKQRKLQNSAQQLETLKISSKSAW